MEKPKKDKSGEKPKREARKINPAAVWRSPHGDYVAHSSTQTTWRDVDGVYEDFPVFRLNLATPFTADVSSAELHRLLKEDFSGCPGFEEMALYSHAEANRRLFYDDKNLVSVQKISRWDTDSTMIVVTTQREFSGFPVSRIREPEDLLPYDDGFDYSDMTDGQ